jgi:hypothetical protein
VRTAIEAASPDVVSDQLTSLPANPADILNSIPNDTRLHRQGGGNLLAAARELGVGRYILQSTPLLRSAAPNGAEAHRRLALSACWRSDLSGSTDVSAAHLRWPAAKVCREAPVDGACSADAQATGRSSIASPGTSRHLMHCGSPWHSAH